jgi:hypothetical protein
MFYYVALVYLRALGVYVHVLEACGRSALPGMLPKQILQPPEVLDIRAGGYHDQGDLEHVH